MHYSGSINMYFRIAWVNALYCRKTQLTVCSYIIGKIMKQSLFKANRNRHKLGNMTL